MTSGSVFSCSPNDTVDDGNSRSLIAARLSLLFLTAAFCCSLGDVGQAPHHRSSSGRCQSESGKQPIKSHTWLEAEATWLPQQAAHACAMVMMLLQDTHLATIPVSCPSLLTSDNDKPTVCG